MPTEALVLTHFVALSTAKLDDIISAAAELPDEELLTFCVNAHNLRHSAMAAVGRKNDPNFEWKLEQIWQKLFNIPTFCFTETITGGKIKPREISPELLQGLDELDSLL